MPNFRSHKATGAVIRLNEKANAYRPRFLPLLRSVLTRLISVSHDVVIVPKETPIINRNTIHMGVESQAESTIRRRPALLIPVNSVRFNPYNSIALPTKGALSAMPTNMAAAVIPVSGVGKCLSSRMAEVTGMITPQHNPTVKTDIITVAKGEKRNFMSKACATAIAETTQSVLFSSFFS